MPLNIHKSHQPVSAQSVFDRLKASGHRLTQARRLLIECLAESSHPLAAQDLIDALSKRNAEVNKTTVYRELDFLEAEGVVRELDFQEGKKRYEFVRHEGVHHHLICNRCQMVECVDLPKELELLESKIKRKYEFDIHGHVFEFFGVCKDCR